MPRILWCLALLVFALPAGARAQEALGLPTAGEREAANVASYVTLGANVALAVVDCRHDGAWDRTCLIRLAVKNGIGIGVSEGFKRLIHERRPCEPARCGRDAGTGSAPSGHTMIAFVNVDPWGQAHLGISVEYSVASATAALRVLSLRHHWWDVVGTAAAAQGINAATRAIIH